MEVVVPDLGDFSDVEVVEVLVKPGDVIQPEDPLITLETDKASLDVPSPAAGRVRELKVATGDRVSTGDPVLLLEETEAAAGEKQPAAERDTGSRAEESRAEDEAAREASDARTATQAGAASGNGADREEGHPERRQAEEAEPSEREAAQAAERPVQVPDLGDFSDVEVVEVLVSEGDEVRAEQGLIALETEKAMVEVPAPEAGTVVALKIKVGDRVSTGDEVLVLRPAAGGKAAPAQRREQAGQAPSSAPAQAKARAPAEEDKRPARRDEKPARAAEQRVIPVDEAGFSRAHASPSVRKLARELGVDLVRVTGSGRKGRVTADDVKAFVKEIMQERGAGGGLPAVPEVDFASFGEVELEPLTRIQRISGPRLQASWINVPHVTHHEQADITELEEARRSLKDQAAERGIRLTPLAFIMRACALVLEDFPRFKSSLAADGRNLVMKRYMHLGFAADTPKGLVVPVIRDADKKDVYELAKALGALSERAREGKLSAAEMQGGVFTISSLGGIGGTSFTPIINAPEVAILGVSRHQWQPVYRDGGFVPRLILPLSLSYDHRVIDGAEAARFSAHLAKTLGEVARLIEAIP